jgi:hypothetical protein
LFELSIDTRCQPCYGSDVGTKGKNKNESNYDEWCERFEVRDESYADADSDISDNPEVFEFFDNGAVRNSEGEFVIKVDAVTAK